VIEAPDLQLELLVQAGDIQGLRRLSETVESRKGAEEAVKAIVQANPRNLNEILKELAAGNSYATGEALEQFWILHEVSTGESNTLYRQRLENGDLNKLWQEGKLDIGRTLQHFDDVSQSPDEFSRAFENLAQFATDKPSLSADLASKTLAFEQTMSGDESFAWRLRNITPEQRLAAFDVLARERPAGTEPLLIELVRKCENQPLRERALESLVTMWRTQPPPEAGAPSRSSLLFGDTLISHTESARALEFNGPADLGSGMPNISNLKKMTPIAKLANTSNRSSSPVAKSCKKNSSID